MSENQVSHYRILQYLGGGAMGKVFLAEDTLLHRQVALKFLPAELTEDEATLKRFKTEARATALLDHPNICNIHEISQSDDGAWFIAMAYYKGRTLKKILEKGPLATERALRYARQIALGLSRAHNEGVVHRDIKPANIMITDREEVKIVDFGLARLTGRTNLTRTGAVIGTAAYMSPEQGRGEEAGAQADIWATGVVFYEMLSGQLPFKGDNEVAMIYSILNQPPIPLPETGCAAPRMCARIIDRCLTKDPHKRYPHAKVLASDLDVAISQHTDHGSTRKSSPSIYIRPRRARWLVLAACVAALLVALAARPGTRGYLMSLVPWNHPAPGVAVMLFELEGGEDASALGLGLSWLVTDKLTQLEDGTDKIWTVPFDDVIVSEPSSREVAARRLGVQHVVGGKGTFDGTNLRLETSIFDPATGAFRTHEFADHYANLHTWQEDLVGWIIEQTAPDLSDEDLVGVAGPGTAVPNAFLAYTVGRGLLAMSGDDPSRHRELVDRARSSFGRAVAQDSSYAGAWAGLGLATWAAYGETPPDSLPAATACLERASRLDSTLVWAPIYLSRVHLDRGDTSAAEATALRAVATRPGNLSARYNLAYLYEKIGRNDTAAAVFREAAATKPRYPRIHRNAGVHHYLRKESQLALEYWQKVMELTPDDCAGYNLLGINHFEAERWDEAREYFLKANAIEPRSGFCSNLATIFYYEGRYLDAIEMYRRSIDLGLRENRVHEIHYSNLGLLAESFRWAPGYEDSARVYYRRALEALEPRLAVHPDDAGLLVDKASFTANLARPGESLAILKGLEGRPDLTTSQMFTMATVFEELGAREKALDWLERALMNGQSIKIVEVYPVLRNLRATERYQSMKRRYAPS